MGRIHQLLRLELLEGLDDLLRFNLPIETVRGVDRDDEGGRLQMYRRRPLEVDDGRHCDADCIRDEDRGVLGQRGPRESASEQSS